MSSEDDLPVGALELVIDARYRDESQSQEIADRAEHARGLADEARLALAQLAEPAVKLIALRLMGIDVDWQGKPVTDDREETAWEVLSRIGVPRLRATAIAASIAAATQAPAPDSPGWVPPTEEDEDEAAKELDPATIDGQIQAFLDGARAQRDLGDLGGST
jgi:hypothetical protein